MKKKFLLRLCLALFLTGISKYTKAQLYYEWVINDGGGNDSDDRARNVVNDPSGNVLWPYATTVNNMGVNSGLWKTDTNNSSPQNTPYESNTNANNIIPQRMAMDGADRYIVGNFKGTVDFDFTSGTNTQTAQGATDGFIAKYNSAGALLWVETISGPGADEVFTVIVKNGNVYVAGTFELNFSFNGTAPLNSLGDEDIFVASFTSAGNLTWVRAIGGTTHDVNPSIDVDTNENIIIVGHYNSPTLTLEDLVGSTVLSVSGPGYSMFIARYNASGVLRWANGITSTGGVWGNGVVNNANGDIFIVGHYAANSGADFDPGPGTALLNSSSGTEMFIARYDTSGAYVWAKSTEGNFNTYGYSIDIEPSGNDDIYVTGKFWGEVDFNPGTGVDTLHDYGLYDAFIAAYTSNGGFLDAYSIGGNGDDEGRFISLYGNDDVFITGVFSDTVDFDISNQADTVIANIYKDAFVAKYTRKAPVIISTNTQQAATFNLYPNPATDVVNIALPENAGKTTLKVYNMQGQLMMQKQLTTTYVDVAQLSNGLYTLTLENDKGLIGRSRLMIAR